MKAQRRSLLLLFATILVLVAGVFAAACGNKVTLTFHTNGGEEIAAEQVEHVEKGSTVQAPVPSRGEEWTFDGWYANEDLTGDRLGETFTAPEEDASYYAKWTQNYLVTLDAGEGTLSKTSLYVKPGANLASALSAQVPTASGDLVFGAWFYGSEELKSTSTTVMPAQAITVTAKYKVSYKVEYYLQNAACDGYELDHDVAGSDYVGQTISAPAASVPHFMRNNRPEGGEAVTSLELKKTASENVFKLYFDRDEYSIQYDGNFPQGAGGSGSVGQSSYVYGQTATVADNGFELDGYRFAGWSTYADGTVEYTEGQTFEIESNLVLYAVWDQGYTDRYGGSDIIFLPSSEPGVAILLRGGVEYKGVATGADFSFSLPNGDTLRGTVGGTTFSYASDDMAGVYVSFSGYVDPDSLDSSEGLELIGIDETETLELDETIGAKWTYVEDGVTHTVEGTYTYDEENESLLFVYADGDGLYGWNFLLNTTTDDDGDLIDIFVRIGGEEGDYVQFVMTDREGNGSIGDMEFTLSGYGYLNMTYGEDILSGYYYIEGYLEMEGMLFYQIESYVVDQDGVLGSNPGMYNIAFYTTLLTGEMKAVVVRDDMLMDEFTGTLDGQEATILMDGYDGVHVTIGGAEYDGTYFARTSEALGYIVSLSFNNQNYSVLLYGDYTFEEFDEEFTEFYRIAVSQSTGATVVGYPLVLIYEDEVENVPGARRADLWYALDESGYLYKVAEGYVEDVELDHTGFMYRHFVRTAMTEDFEDLSADVFEEISFVTESETLIYDVYYVLGVKYEDEEKMDIYLPIAEEDGDGMFYYTDVGDDIPFLGSVWAPANGDPVKGGITFVEYTFLPDTVIMQFTYYVGRTRTVRLFELIEHGEGDDASYTYVELEYEPYYIYEQDVDGTLRQPARLYFDGKGGAMYYKDPPVNFATAVPTLGKVEESGDYTALGDVIYRFVADDNDEDSFEYTLSTYGSMTVLHKWDEEAKTFGNDDCGTFEIDGFNNHAFLTDKNGNGRMVEYYHWGNGDLELPEGCELAYAAFEESGYYRVIYILDDDTIQIGSLVYNFSSGNIAVLTDDSFMTYNNKSLIVMFDDANGAVMIMSKEEDLWMGTFECINEEENLYLFRLTDTTGDLGEFTLTVKMYFEADVCAVYDSTVEGKYLADDWSSIELDGYAFANYISPYGDVYEDIGYVLLDDNIGLLEFGSDGGVLLFSYNKAQKTFALVDNSAYISSYLTADLGEVLLFGESAVIINGQIVGYWVAGETDVTLYVISDEEGTAGMILSQKISLPGGAKYTFEGQEYLLWDDDIAFEGAMIVGETEDGEPDLIEGFTLTLLPDGDVELTHPDLEGESVTGFYIATTEEGAVLVDAYENIYDITLNYLGNGKGNFTVTAGDVKVAEYVDLAEEGNSIWYGWFGVGGLTLSEQGWFYHFEATDSLGNKIDLFTQYDPTQFAYSDEETMYGIMCGISFKGSDGLGYGVDFFVIDDEEGYPAYLIVYSVYRYVEIEVEEIVNNRKYDYTLVMQKNIYSPAFELPIGDLTVMLLRGTGSSATYLPIDEELTVIADDGSWIAYASTQSDATTWYLVQVTLSEDGLPDEEDPSSVSVHQSTHGTVQDEKGEYSADYLVYTDADGNEQAFVYQLSKKGEGDEFTAIEGHLTAADGTFTLTAEDGVYTVTLTEADEDYTLTVTFAEVEPVPEPAPEPEEDLAA